MKIAIIVGALIVVAIAVGVVFYFRSYKKQKEINRKLIESLKKSGIRVDDDVSKMPVPLLPRAPKIKNIEWWAEIKTANPFIVYREAIMTPCIIAWKSKFEREGHLAIFRRASNPMADGFYQTMYPGYKKLKPEELEKPLTGRVSAYANAEKAFEILFSTDFAPTYLRLKNMNSLNYADGVIYLEVKSEFVTGVNSVKSLAKVVDALEKSLHEPIKTVDGAELESAMDEVVGISYHNLNEKKEYYGKFLVNDDVIIFIAAWKDALTARVAPSVYVPIVDTAELDPRTAEYKFEFPVGSIKKASLNKNPIMKVIGYILRIETETETAEFQSMPESNARLKDVLVRHGYIKTRSGD